MNVNKHTDFENDLIKQNYVGKLFDKDLDKVSFLPLGIDVWILRR